MLTAIHKESSERMLAEEADSSVEYVCPACRWPVVLKAGRLKVPHFAHKPGTPCFHGQGETMAHLSCKLSLYRALHRAARHPALEVVHGGFVSDVVFQVNGHAVSIEVQRSALTVDQIHDRTKKYAERGIPVLWLLLNIPQQEETGFLCPRSWQKWLHTLYFGRVYVWNRELMVMPVHFAPALITGSFGNLRYSRRYHELASAPEELHLLEDFSPQFIRPSHDHLAGLPPLWLYRDTQRAWWKRES
jgi:competence protein CoiA